MTRILDETELRQELRAFICTEPIRTPDNPLQDDEIAYLMPLYHDGGMILGTIMSLVCGVPLVLMSPLDWVQHPAILFRALGDFGATFCNMTNVAFDHLIRRVREHDVEGLSLAGTSARVNGSERVLHASFERFVERFAAQGVTRDWLGVAYELAENAPGADRAAPRSPRERRPYPWAEPMRRVSGVDVLECPRCHGR